MHLTSLPFLKLPLGLLSFALNLPISPILLPTSSRELSVRSKAMRSHDVVQKLVHDYERKLEHAQIPLSYNARVILENCFGSIIHAAGPVVADHETESVLPLLELPAYSIPRALHVGTGLSVTKIMAQEIASAQQEVVLVVCFWAKSPSLEVLSDALRTLNNAHDGKEDKVRVRIGFSSSSAWQKLTHTTSPVGEIYPPEKWQSLGLPEPDELQNLDMAVKSLFYLPFSVLHGKYLIIDRKRLFLPSANISWEVWGECVTAFEGPLVDIVIKFWWKIWVSPELDNPVLEPDPLPSSKVREEWDPPASMRRLDSKGPYPTVFLTQPHHRNPAYNLPFPLRSCFGKTSQLPPMTPQNAFLLSSIRNAKSSIYVQTPNLTAGAVIEALENALSRGVNVDIVTCRWMMMLEQLITTLGTAVTELCIRDLIKKRGSTGRLNVYYYTGAVSSQRDEEAAIIRLPMDDAVQSHVKATIIDNEITVLGSANMDRASWYTSQEINVAVIGEDFAKIVREELVKGLGGRLEKMCGTNELRNSPLQ